MSNRTEITREDILSMEEYGQRRMESRKRITAIKKNRRLAIGPDATIYFENYDTMWHQIHEMLWIEKGGDEQIEDELRAYNPLIPNGSELVATLMFEIDDPERRAHVLAGLGGVEHTIEISLGDEVITAVPEEDVERTNAAGKASSIQFLHFPFTAEQVARFRDPDVRITVGIGHTAYGHMAILSPEVREALSGDFLD